MRKNVKRLLCGLLAAALLIPAAAAAPASGQKTKLSDIQGHWAEQQIEQAVSEGWVDGYPDGTFRPDETITQAEFTKLLLAAFQLTPDSDTVAWMKSIAAYPHDKGGYMDIEPYTPTLSDMKGHWLTKQGWLDAAIYSGILVPADHTGGKYGPDLPVRRYTMALQAIRAMGFVGAAETVSTADLAFSDNAEIQEWVKGYVKLATQYGVMNGYPDGSFGPKRTATRAEAVVTVARALDYNRGDGEIQASMELYRYFAYPHGSESAEPFVTNRVRMLAADGRIYVNARDLFTEIGVDGGWRWFPTRQVLYVSGGNTSYKFQMGNDYWVGRSQQDFAYAEPTPRDNELLGIVRFYNGNPMLPLHDFNRPVHSPEGFLWSNFQGEWDAATRTLSFSICDPTPNGS